MAPTASKRSRPAFSPPRPGKSKSTKTAKDKSTNGAKRKEKTGKGSRVEKKTPAKRSRTKKTQGSAAAGGTIRGLLDEEADDSDEEEEEEEEPVARSNKRQQQVLDDGDEPSDEDDEGDGGDVREELDEDEAEEEDAAEPSQLESSPEPDFILAEVTHNDQSASDTSDPTITLPLIHRIMQSHFSRPEKTSLSADARVLVGKYIDIFVKEGIRRCVDEKKEREQNAGAGVDSGWLELEDLERVATQLCMDF
ncbi:CENP-S associating centromere protein X-domain-containing protein [Exophiala viscosa]|uniref:CENP-S associating centromere protein X-domain-containing protein n=1 Tax=Exophiala viscosa TaxID=2486360 RepID=UPI002190882D|nr:CENP-S associating centromere protein X-domain-containing protein [Exophiala viscosa]